MDCQTFDSSLMDALYEELDDEASRALRDHAATCAACQTRLTSFDKTRALVASALAAPSGGSPDLEDRILAAAHAAMDARPPEVRRAPRAGRMVELLSAPRLALAATFLLVLGGAAALLRTSREPSAPASADAVERGVAASPAAPAPPAPVMAATAAPVAPSTAVALDAPDAAGAAKTVHAASSARTTPAARAAAAATAATPPAKPATTKAKADALE